MKTTFLVLAILMLLLFGTVAVGLANASGYTGKENKLTSGVRGYTPHAVIIINNNTDFSQQAASAGWPGDGSAGNPYLISGYDIDAHGADAIYIGNTTSHFTVENCKVYNATHGIYLINVKNGDMLNNTIHNSEYGMYLKSSSNNNITNNSVFNNTFMGIFLYFSTSNIIANNSALNNSRYGISLYSSSSNSIDNNSLILTDHMIDSCFIQKLFSTIKN